MEEAQTQLLTEQLLRFKDGIEARLKRLEQSINHQQRLEEERLGAVKNELRQVRELLQDHEKRIRTVDDSVISLKTTATLVQALQASLTLIAASIAAWLGGRQ